MCKEIYPDERGVWGLGTKRNVRRGGEGRSSGEWDVDLGILGDTIEWLGAGA